MHIIPSLSTKDICADAVQGQKTFEYTHSEICCIKQAVSTLVLVCDL